MKQVSAQDDRVKFQDSSGWKDAGWEGIILFKLMKNNHKLLREEKQTKWYKIYKIWT